MNQKKLQKEARKALKQSSGNGGISQKFKDIIEEKKAMINANSDNQNQSKRELKNIEADKYYPLTLASKYLPIKDIKDGIVITTDKRYLKSIEVSPINFELKNDYDKLDIIDAFESYLRIAPRKMQIKCVSKRASANAMLKALKVAKIKETQPSAISLNEDYARFVQRLAVNEGVERKFYITYEYEADNKLYANFDDAKNQLEDTVRTAKSYLEGCECGILEDDEKSKTYNQARIIYEVLNKNKSRDIPFGINASIVQDKWIKKNGEEARNDLSIAEMVSPEEISFENAKYIKVDDMYYTHMFLSANGGYPSNTVIAWLSDITTMGEGIDVDLFIEREDADAMSSKIFRTTKVNTLRANDANEKGGNTDNARYLNDSVMAGQYLLDGLNNRQDFYYVNTMITISASSVEELETKTKIFKQSMKSKTWDLYNCLHLQEQAYNAYMPFLNLDKRLYKATRRNVLTCNLKGFFPFTSYSMAEGKGIVLGVEKSSHSLIAIDLHDRKTYKNGNTIILGTSGAGKTYTLMLLTGRHRLLHTPTTIITPEKGEEPMRYVKRMGGSIISISPESDKCINVMEIRPKDNEASKYIDGVEVEKSLMIEKVQSLLTFFSLLVPDISYEEKTLVDKAILDVYKDFGITKDNDSIYNPDGTIKTMPILGDLYNKLIREEDTRRVANIMYKLVDGSANTFNKQTNVDLNNEYTLIDISQLKDDMLVIGMYVALDFVWSKYREDRTKKKIIAIDEIWKLLGGSSSELAAQYVLEMFKTARGYGISAIGATQDLSDFYTLANGKYGKGIINNSKIKILLQLETDEANTAQESLDLTENEKNRVKKLKTGEAMIIANQNNLIARIESSDLEHIYITTDSDELNKFKEMKIEKETSQSNN